MSKPPILPANDQILVKVSPVGMSQKGRLELAREALQEMEADIASASLFIMAGALSFAEVEPGYSRDDAGELIEEAPPKEWENELERMYPGRGAVLAEQKLRIAKAAWLPSKEAPVALKMAQATAIGLARIRAGDRQAARGLNVQVVQVIEPRQQYEELEVEEKKR